MNPDTIIEQIRAHPVLSKPGERFDCRRLAKEIMPEIEYPGSLSMAAGVLVARGQLMELGRRPYGFFGNHDYLMRLVLPHENVRESVLRELAEKIANPGPKQIELWND